MVSRKEMTVEVSRRTMEKTPLRHSTGWTKEKPSGRAWALGWFWIESGAGTFGAVAVNFCRPVATVQTTGLCS
jgi:hypothetical protein